MSGHDVSILAAESYRAAWPWRDHKVFAPLAKARFSPDDMECPGLDR